MNNEIKKQIIECIAIPIALKTISLDKKLFEETYAGKVYVAKLNSIEHQMRKDYSNLKERLFNEHKIFVRKDDNKNYSLIKGNQVNSLQFTSEQLKEMTTQTIDNYLHDPNIQFEVSGVVGWKVLNMPPPDIDDLLD